MSIKYCTVMVFALIILLYPLKSGADDGSQKGTEGRIPLDHREQTAVAASISGTVVTRNIGKISIEAIPGQSGSAGCIPVEVISSTPQWKKINRYTICSGLITSEEDNTAELEAVEKEKADNFDLFVLEIAKKAGQHGLAQGIFQDYTLKATALRREGSCSVEVSIFQGTSLIKKVMHPCE